MRSWPKAAALGVLTWVVPFVVAVLIFPLRETVRPPFESIMAVVVTGTAVVLGLSYLRTVERHLLREGLVWVSSGFLSAQRLTHLSCCSVAR